MYEKCFAAFRAYEEAKDTLLRAWIAGISSVSRFPVGVFRWPSPSR
jgi:hypothetical protein